MTSRSSCVTLERAANFGDLQSAREEFGYRVIGPILATMLEQLLCSLLVAGGRDMHVAFFCSRGGLILRRLLEFFLARTDRALPLRFENFMISRLSAARVALQQSPAAAAPLVERELMGRSCADAARAFADVDAGADRRWAEPFSVDRFSALERTTEIGRAVGIALDQQADLLRSHIDALRGGADRIILCDTGVFGSIGRYLQLGVPAIRWWTALLYRANYKGLPAPHFVTTSGVISERDRYAPWRPETVILLYWPFLETLLEPDLPSVRSYRTVEDSRVVSNLEIEGWTSRLEPVEGSVLCGARHYLAELSSSSVAAIGGAAREAWKRLRRMIVYPTLADVALLAVGRRELDFGFDDAVAFNPISEERTRTIRSRIALIEASIWPEGELKKQFPRSAVVALRGLEALRLIRALINSSGGTIGGGVEMEGGRS